MAVIVPDVKMHVYLRRRGREVTVLSAGYYVNLRLAAASMPEIGDSVSGIERMATLATQPMQ